MDITIYISTLPNKLKQTNLFLKNQIWCIYFIWSYWHLCLQLPIFRWCKTVLQHYCKGSNNIRSFPCLCKYNQMKHVTQTLSLRCPDQGSESGRQGMILATWAATCARWWWSSLTPLSRTRSRNSRSGGERTWRNKNNKFWSFFSLSCKGYWFP